MIRVLLLAPLALLPACSDQPKAPPLTQESVYQNDAIGLRFLVPAGWTMQSRAMLPSGPLPRPIVIVTYQGNGEKPAEFRLLAADLAENTDLPQFLASHPVGADKWPPQSAVEPVTINESQASRFVLTRSQGKDEMRREVTAFRRGERVYFFLVDYAASDAGSRDTVRTSIESVKWKK